MLNASIYDIIRLTDNCITLAQGEQYFQMSDSIPEAVSQAIALSEVTELVQLVHTDKTLTWHFLQESSSSILPNRWKNLGLFCAHQE